METRANHFAVGIFVLLAIASASGFVVWLAKSDIEKAYAFYLIDFDGSVTGLSKASAVRYLGVAVGDVIDVRINPDNTEQVRVTIKVDGRTPIKTDFVASLELQGITGLRYVQITGGDRNSPALEPRPGKEFAVIQSMPSKLEALFQDVPTLVARLAHLVEAASRLLTPDNIAALIRIIEGLDTLTGSVVTHADSIGGIVNDARATLAEARQTAERIHRLSADMSGRFGALADNAGEALEATTGTFETTSETLTTAQSALDSVGASSDALLAEIETTLGDVRQTTVSIGKVATELERVIAENRVPIHDFTADGLYEFTRFLVETRALVASVTVISRELGSDLARFLFGDSETGYQPK